MKEWVTLRLSGSRVYRRDPLEPLMSPLFAVPDSHNSTIVFTDFSLGYAAINRQSPPSRLWVLLVASFLASCQR